jgi:hypothetical protein
MIDCATIRDLLPLYVDDVLSKESNALVSGHLATCENCKNEFINMQSEIKKLKPDNGEKIDVLKTMKKTIFRQKVIVAIVASFVTVAIVIGGFYGVFHYATPIEYEEGIFRVERSEMMWENNGITETSIDLNLISAKNFYSSNSISRIIDVNGTETEVTFIYLSGTLYTKRWQSGNGNNTVRFAGAIGSNPLAVEMYYLIAPFGEWFPMSDEDFYAQRNDAVLLWSGTLE